VRHHESRPSAAAADWRLSRIDIRSPVAENAWPVARLELEHPERGRVTDIGTAPGAFDAAFAAAGHILGVSPRLVSYHVRSAARAVAGALSIEVVVALELGGRLCVGSSFGVDLVRCSLIAWLDAVSKLDAGEPASDAATERPYQVRGIDENNDLWIFASADEGAASAIAAEFLGDNYLEVSLLGESSGQGRQGPSPS
jgi:hypothetical protein